MKHEYQLVITLIVVVSLLFGATPGLAAEELVEVNAFLVDETFSDPVFQSDIKELNNNFIWDLAIYKDRAEGILAIYFAMPDAWSTDEDFLKDVFDQVRFLVRVFDSNGGLLTQFATEKLSQLCTFSMENESLVIVPNENPFVLFYDLEKVVLELAETVEFGLYCPPRF